MQLFEPKEILEIKKSLIAHHGVFRCFWDLCTPIYSQSIKTACVEFDQDGNYLKFLINPNFWHQKNLEEKKFIICHECLHILRGHGLRSIGKINKQNNLAMDIVVNESLVKFFSFKKETIDPLDEYIWFDKFFKNNPEIEAWRNFEYYAPHLNENDPHEASSHDYLSSIPSDILKKIIQDLDDDELTILKNKISDSIKNQPENENNYAGTHDGGLIKEFAIGKIKKKHKWESIIKKFEKSFSKQELEEDCWFNKTRRNFNLNSNLFTPNEIESNIRKSNFKKIPTWFFLDTSGSCWNISERFFKAAKSLDEEKFDVKYFCFDTKVYPLNINKNKIFGGGGTSFSAIAQYIYNSNNNEKPFVWILTDGYGDYINIPDKQKKKWHWFLTENPQTDYIPKECHIYNLGDFE